MARDLIVVAEDWGGLPTSAQHLIRNLGGKRRILWVNSLGMRRPRLTRHDVTRAARKLRAMIAPSASAGGPAERIGDTRLPDGMEVLAPRAISWPGLNLAYTLNKQLFGRQLQAKAEAMGLKDPLLMIAYPTGLVALSAGVHDKAIYYCADDYGAIDGVDHAPALAMEKVLVDKVDLVLATSEVLLDKFPAEKTKLLPHGVDAEKFAAPAPRPADLPEGKVAGFYGSFIDRIDIDMLRRTALALADWQFVFIGNIRPAEREPLDLPNVRFLGPRRHDDLPGYVQHWTVSMLPFRDCAMVRAMNPLKLREYLAAGTPIATTPFPAMAPYRSLIEVAEGDTDFAAAIVAASGDGARDAERRASVAGESWRARAADLEAVLEAM